VANARTGDDEIREQALAELATMSQEFDLGY
jgi:hypothetical protein